jgi:hypothetical protein
MLDIMQTVSQDFVLWSFAGTQDISFRSVSQDDIIQYLDWGTIQSISDSQDFFNTIGTLISEDSVVVVTGSLYWLGRVYVTFS